MNEFSINVCHLTINACCLLLETYTRARRFEEYAIFTFLSCLPLSPDIIIPTQHIYHVFYNLFHGVHYSNT